MLNAEITLYYDRCGSAPFDPPQSRHTSPQSHPRGVVADAHGSFRRGGADPGIRGRGCQVTFTQAGKTTISGSSWHGPFRSRARQAG